MLQSAWRSAATYPARKHSILRSNRQVPGLLVKSSSSEGASTPQAQADPWQINVYWTPNLWAALEAVDNHIACHYHDHCFSYQAVFLDEARRTKKKDRLVDRWGHIADGEMLDPVGWTEDSQWHLAIQIASQELRLPEEMVVERLQLLQSLLPDMKGCMKVADVIRFSARLSDIAEKLLLMRGVLPGANVSHIACRHPDLLLLGAEQLRAGIEQVKHTLAVAPDRGMALIHSSPAVLANPEVLDALIDELSRLFGKDRTGAVHLLAADPSLAHSCQGLRHQERGNREDGHFREDGAMGP